MNNSNLFYDNKKGSYFTNVLYFSFLPRTLVGGGGGGKGVVFWRSVFKYFGVPCLSIPAFHV